MGIIQAVLKKIGIVKLKWALGPPISKRKENLRKLLNCTCQVFPREKDEPYATKPRGTETQSRKLKGVLIKQLTHA
jgi:hypothetical protein